LLFLAVSIFTGDEAGMAWVATGMAKTTPAEIAVAIAKVLMLNTIRSSCFSL
jgi:hypothetical protein